MAPLRVLISGAGVAGPTLAFWLAHSGHSVTVVERHPQLRTHGQQIDLRAHAITTVERMGLKEEILKHNVDEKGLQVINASGQRQVFWGRSEEEEEGGGMTKAFTSEIEIMRMDLGTVLYDASKNKVKYRFGLTVEDYEIVGDGVNVKFSDKTWEKFDLLVAADGHNSRIRKMMLQKDQSIKDDSLSVGLFIAYFQLARQPDDQDCATLCHFPGRRSIMTRWHTNDIGQGYLFTRSSKDLIRSALGKDANAQKEAFAKVFTDGPWQSNRLVKAMHEAEDFYAEEITQRRSNRWHSGGRVVLLGDAAYAPSSMTGMGTSLAIVGAYVLAGELAKHGADIGAGLEAYEGTLRPHVKQLQTLPPGIWGPSFPQTQLGVRLLHLVMRTAMWLDLPSKIAWLDAGSKWTLPEYKELENIK